MARARRKKAKRTESSRSDSGATTGHEAALWAMADALRGSMDAAEYKHVVLGLIFLKYISDAFEEMRIRASKARWPKARIQRTRTSTVHRTSSGYRPRPAGAISSLRHDNPPSASLSTAR